MWRRLPQEWAQSSVKPTYEAWVAVSQDLLPPSGEGSTCLGPSVQKHPDATWLNEVLESTAYPAPSLPDLPGPGFGP